MKRIFIYLMLMSFFCQAQEKQKKTDIRLIINATLTKHLDKDLLGKTTNNSAYLFSITLSFNERGKIDTVYFPKEIYKNENEVMRLDAILVKKIRLLNLEYKDYASKLVFIPFFYYRTSDNGVNYENGFLKSLENLLPKINGNALAKDWVVLDPFINPFSLIIN